MNRFVLLLAFMSVVSMVESAGAETIDGLDVTVEGAAIAVVHGGRRWEIPVPFKHSRMSRVTIDVIPIGDGKHVVHVRVGDRERQDVAFEALVGSAKDAPIWAGMTGYTRGGEGERAGDVVRIYDRDTQSKFVIVAEVREDTRICGQELTPLSPRGIDPQSLELRGATLQRLDKYARDRASEVVGTARTAAARPPLARMLAATGGSGQSSELLTDGDLATTWFERRPGDGHGEFVTMRAPGEVELRSILITPAPPKDKKEAPRTFYLATDLLLFRVTMPEDAKPGQTYELPIPPLKTSCVAIVLDEAYSHGKDAPDVGVAEIAATTRFDEENASLRDVAAALGRTKGNHRDESAALLRRAGGPGLDAVVTMYPSLDFEGRALAIDVAASAGTCDGAAGKLLTEALTDRESEVRRRALGRIERCGKSAATALAAAVRSDDETRRMAAAPLLAAIAPSLAVKPLAEQLGKGGIETRRAVRSALARVAPGSTRDTLLVLLKRDQALPARLDLLRALGPKLGELRPESDAAIADMLAGAPDFATRYLVLEPLAHLANAPGLGNSERARLSSIIAHDREWPIRARAVELAAGNPSLVPSIVAAVMDSEPRVREAALRAMAASHATQARAASVALEKDPWTFVRVAAAAALAAIPADPDAPHALERALQDPNAKVRYAAIDALAHLRAMQSAPLIRERLDDTKEDVDVRAFSARALGAMCVRSATDRLTKLALAAIAPASEGDDRMGLAAIEALGMIHPVDLEQRLAPLLAKDVSIQVRRAVERAIHEPSGCP